MPADSKKKPAKQEAPEPTPIMGYRPRPRYRDVTFDTVEVEDGAEPLTCRIRTHLTFGEIDEIGYRPGVRYEELEVAIAPYVVAWNVMAEAEDGTFAPVPPPAEAGPEAFKCISGPDLEWLAVQLSRPGLGTIEELNARESAGTITPEEAALKNGSTPSASTPGRNGVKSSA